MGIVSGTYRVAIRPLFPGRIGIWKCWFLWREKNRSTRRKTLGAGTRTNNKLNPRKVLIPGIEPGPHWWEVSAFTTAPSLLPNLLPAPNFEKRANKEPCTKWKFNCNLTHTEKERHCTDVYMCTVLVTNNIFFLERHWHTLHMYMWVVHVCLTNLPFKDGAY